MNMQHRKMKDTAARGDIRPVSEAGAADVRIEPLTGRPNDEISEPSLKAEPEGRGPTARASSDGLAVRILRGGAKLILPILILAGAFAGYKYLKATKPSAPKRVQAERVYAVDTVTAVIGDYQPMLTLYGATVAGRQVDIRAFVSGRVVATGETLREGGEIDKGAMLVEIDSFDFKISVKEAEAQLAEARARKVELEASLAAEKVSMTFASEQVALAKRDVSRAKPLVRRKALSQQTLEQRENVVSQRQQALQTLQSTIGVWGARIAQQDAIIQRLTGAKEIAERRLTETKLTAPFNAYITNVTTQAGRTVTANDTIATLIDRDWIEARFVLTNEQYGRIVAAEGKIVGRPIDVTWALGDSRFTYKAEVAQVGAQINSDTGGVELFARIKDPLKPTPLRAGAFVEITVPDRKFDQVFKLPAAALYEGNTVYAVVDGRLAPHKVKVIGGSGAEILVTGKLTSGSEVITTRLSKPGKGVRVQTMVPTS